MSKNVFANGKEVSAKKDDNKSIASMPDVCLSPPSPPAGPVPIPYPNTAQASDTSDGSKTVKIGGGEVGLKNASNYKKSTGDEAATKSLGMGVVSHTIQGKLKFAAWSMDVKFEGQNAIRHMDMTTQNHMNCPDAVAGLSTAAEKSPPKDEDCKELEKANQDAQKKDTESGNLGEDCVIGTGKLNDGPVLKGAAPIKQIKSGKTSGYCPSKPREMAPPGKPFKSEAGKDRKSRTPLIACMTEDRYNDAAGGNVHAEAQMIESVFKGMGAGEPAPPGSTLKMRIHWNDPKEGRRTDPCPNCKSAICKVVHFCDLKILICQDDGTSQPAPCKNGKWKSPRKPKPKKPKAKATKPKAK